jgi:hypothetical protein
MKGQVHKSCRQPRIRKKSKIPDRTSLAKGVYPEEMKESKLTRFSSAQEIKI